MDNNPKPPMIQDLYPDLSTVEQSEAEENFHQYINLAKRIHNCLIREGKLDEISEQLRKDTGLKVRLEFIIIQSVRVITF